MNLLHLVSQAESNKNPLSPCLLELINNSVIKSRKECPLKFESKELFSQLTPLQFEVTQRKGTEKAYCSYHLKNKGYGVYSCVVCHSQLFHSNDKFDSRTGWPAFFQALDISRLAFFKDSTYGTTRVEVACSNCGAHLGHVFDDGPRPTGLRYCVNSVSLDFQNSNDDNNSSHTQESPDRVSNSNQSNQVSKLSSPPPIALSCSNSPAVNRIVKLDSPSVKYQTLPSVKSIQRKPIKVTDL